jgi:hypothetical protein
MTLATGIAEEARSWTALHDEVLRNLYLRFTWYVKGDLDKKAEIAGYVASRERTDYVCVEKAEGKGSFQKVAVRLSASLEG